MDTEKIINYWLKIAEKDLNIAISLLNLKHYLYCLFFCHLVTEKILKALVVKETKNHAPHTHNLIDLAEQANLELSLAQIDFLDKLLDYNLEARYPDFKLKAYKKANPELAKRYLADTKELFLWLKEKI